MKFLKFLAAFVVALVVSACSGGGGGSTPTPTPVPVIPAPSGNASVTPSSCQISAGLGKCTVNVTFATANATTASLTTGGGAVLSTSLSGSQVVDVLIGTNTYTLTANGKVVASATSTGVCATGTTSNGTDCVAPVTWWPPKVIAPVGVAVNGANQLPIGCTSDTQKCWTDAIADGTVKAVASDATDAGRAIVGLFFLNTTQFAGNSGYWNILPYHLDDGSRVSLSDIWGGSGNEIYTVWGSARGFIYQYKDYPDLLCREIVLSKMKNMGIDDEIIPCPSPK